MYSMFELLPILSTDTVAQIPRGETKIETVTGTRGRLTGVISGVPSYIRLGYSKAFQECFTVTIHWPLSPGDSGSTIIDSRTGQIYGHIMVGSVISRTAYIIPATSILKDLKIRERMNENFNTSTPGMPFLNMKDNTVLLQGHHPISAPDEPPSVLPWTRSFKKRPREQEDASDDNELAYSDEDYLSSDYTDPDCTFSDYGESDAGSDSSFGGLAHANIVPEIVFHLLQSELRDLFQDIVTATGPEKAKETFRTFISRYGRDLKDTASDSLEMKASRFIRCSATHIAMGLVQGNSETNTYQLREYLEMGKPNPASQDEDQVSDNSDLNEDDIHDDSALDRIKRWMNSGPQFENFKEALERSLKKPDEQVELSKLEAAFQPGQCSLPGCKKGPGAYFFKTVQSYRSHLKTVHSKSLPCTHPTCSHTRPFTSQTDLNRHALRHGNKADKPYKCLKSNCPPRVKEFKRKDKLREHSRKYHSDYVCFLCQRNRWFETFEEFVEHTNLEHRSELSPPLEQDPGGLSQGHKL